ncbi:MAG TPA: hypothetical protein VMB82_04225, partial [Acidimicrobiales bacterium]|nr:hypothetical protein [Acidimicrobiales bacterium]
TTFTLAFTVNQNVNTPSILAVAIPGAKFGTTTNPNRRFTVSCSPSCTGTHTPFASVWDSTGTFKPQQSGATSILLNFFASTKFTGTFASGETVTVTLTTVTLSGSGPAPVSVAVESAPGTVAAIGTTTTPTKTTIAKTGVKVIAITPNSLGYPRAAWTDVVSNLHVTGTGGKGVLSLYVAGATFPTASSDYVASTCTTTATGTTSTTAKCSNLTVTVDDTATSGLPGTAGLVDVTNTAATATLTGLTLTLSDIGNPAGAATAPVVVVGEGSTTFSALVGAGTSAPAALVASPTVSLTSTTVPTFPTSMVVGTTAAFGLTVANGSDYSWRFDGAAVSFTLAGLSGLTPSQVDVSCTTIGSFTFTTAKGGTLVSDQLAVPLAAGATTAYNCTLALSGSAPTGTLGVGAALNDVTTSTPALLWSSSATVNVVPLPTTGYTMAAADGGIFTYGTASFHGSMGGKPLNKPIVGLSETTTGEGYWMVASDGGIFSFGAARFYGSMGGRPLNQPIVGMATTPTGQGYWLVASDGGIFSFGSAKFFGSMGGKPLNRPVVGMAATNDGQGYWLVASDGGIFSFGDAVFHGSAGSLPLKAPMVGMAATPDGDGYWLVASDGGIFTFGDAPFEGSAGALPLVKPVVGMTPTGNGNGYWLAAADGGVFTFGDAPFEGSAGGLRLVAPMVAIA